MNWGTLNDWREAFPWVFGYAVFWGWCLARDKQHDQIVTLLSEIRDEMRRRK